MEILVQMSKYFEYTSYGITVLFLIIGVMLLLTKDDVKERCLKFAAIVTISVVIITRIISAILYLIVYLKSQGMLN